jgi:hypothetical protein
MILGLDTQSKSDRHASIQAIRNFGEAVRGTLELIRQPGIDSFVSMITIPLILLFIDFRAFILEIAYILIYFFADLYTTHIITNQRFSGCQDRKLLCITRRQQRHRS